MGGDMAGKGPPAVRRRHGQDWRVGEVALLFLVERTDEGKRKLAELLERTEDAVDLAWRWCEEAKFPKEAGNRIERHLERVKAVFGAKVRGQTKL